MVQESLKLITETRPSNRELGDYWSKVFADMMNQHFGVHKFDKAPSPIISLPSGEKIILADVMLLEQHGGNFYCEVKHKSPTRTECYGLEEYRLNSLRRLQEYAKGVVLYVVHDHFLAGGKFITINNPNHWKCVEINNLQSKTYTSWGPSIVNGVYKDVPICYWKVDLWAPLKSYFKTI
jgi:hypothetical protein